MNERIKDCRKKLGLSKTQLAKAIGISTPAFMKWEDGTTTAIGLPHAAKLCEIFDVSLNWLWYGVDSNDIRRIPIVGSTQAGPDKEWFNLDYPLGYSDEYVDFPAKNELVYALRVVGDSMASRIVEGEAVIVDPKSEPETGEEVIVILANGDVMIKILAKIKNGTIFLDSYNNGYSRITISLEKVQAIHPVIGVARSSKIISA